MLIDVSKETLLKLANYVPNDLLNDLIFKYHQAHFGTELTLIPAINFGPDVEVPCIKLCTNWAIGPSVHCNNIMIDNYSLYHIESGTRLIHGDYEFVKSFCDNMPSKIKNDIDIMNVEDIRANKELENYILTFVMHEVQLKDFNWYPCEIIDIQLNGRIDVILKAFVTTEDGTEYQYGQEFKGCDPACVRKRS